MPRLLLAVCVAWATLAMHADAATTFTVTGRFLYEDKAWDYDGWTGEDPELPIRQADVTILDAGSSRVLGRGATAEDGTFSVLCTTKSDAAVDVVARVHTENRWLAKSDKRLPRLRVTAPDKALFTASSPTVPAHDPAGDLDVGTTTALKVVVGNREGNPFNIFDMAVRAYAYLLAADTGYVKRARSVRLFWPNPAGSYAIGRRASIGTTDAYDDAVILHEIGHVVHNVYSDSDNPGGVHYFGDSDQDPRLSFGEGWATAFAGIVLDSMGLAAEYVDASASKQVGGVGLHVRLETADPYFDAVLGASDEVAVACVIWDLFDGAGAIDVDPFTDDDPLGSQDTVGAGLTAERAFWDVFTGPVRKARKVTINHAWDGWVGLFGEDASYAGLQAAYDGRSMRFWNDAFEPDNSADLATPLALATGDDWGPEHTLYYAPPGAPGPGTGDRDWFSLELQAGWIIRIETRYPDGTWDAATQVDPFVTLHDPAGKKFASDDDDGTGRNALLADVLVTETGTWSLCVSTKNKLHRYGRYNVRVIRLDD